MNRYLIDENLPYYFSLWDSDKFIHVFDLIGIKSDVEIWDYAKVNNLIIVTKDSDFSNRIMFKTPPPKVIHIRFGNVRIKNLNKLLTNMWSEIENAIKDHKLVNVYTDRIESIS